MVLRYSAGIFGGIQSFRIALKYDKPKRTTVALVSIESPYFENTQDDLKSATRNCRGAILNPLLFQLLFFELVHQYNQQGRHYVVTKLRKLQDKVDLLHYSTRDTLMDEPDNLDLVRITRDLTRLQIRLEIEKRNSDQLQLNKPETTKLHRCYLNSLEPEDYERALPLWTEIQERLEQVFSHSKMLTADLEMYRSHAQALVQTVCYCTYGIVFNATRTRSDISDY